MIVFDYADHESFTQLYQAIVERLIVDPQYKIAPRGLNINEIVNASVIVKPTDCSIDFTKTGAPERQEVYEKYKKAEHDWYLSGDTLASSAPSKFWNQLADKSGHITSNYGHMMLKDRIYPVERDVEQDDDQTAFERVVETLRKDRDSRQAIVHYNQPKHCWPGNKDFPCTMSSQFFIRGDKLFMTTTQRSCDVVKGFSYDVPWNVSFMEMVAKELGVECGELTMVFGSLHLHEKDIDLAAKIVSPAL